MKNEGKRDLKIIFMGTPAFAVPSLRMLVESGYNIVGVVTSTDKYGGRGKKQLLESAVKQHASKLGLNILQPANLKNEKFIKTLAELGADLQVVVAFRMLPEIVWNMPPLGTINLHASLLPKYRGAAPMNWAIIEGEKETGLTTFKLKHEIDTGDLLYQTSIPIGEDTTAGELHDQMMEEGASLVLKTVHAIEQGEARELPQDQALVTKAPKIFHADCEIDFDNTANRIHNFIRGLSPYPTAWSKLDDKKLKIFRSSISDVQSVLEPGEIKVINGDRMLIGTADGIIEVFELQIEGRKKMTSADFLNGYTIRNKKLSS